MAKIYTDLLVAGRKQFSQVPAQLQLDVKVVLQGYAAAGTITPEKYEEIVGEPYVG